MNVYFDLDGTLINITKRHYLVYEDSTLYFGGNPLSQIKYWMLKREKKSWREILQLSQLDPNIIDIFLEYFIKKIETKSILKKDTLIPHSLEVLNHISETSDCYLVSLRRNKDNLFEQLDWLGITHIFKAIKTGHSEYQGDDVKTMLIRSDRAQKGIIIGDTEADIITGHNLGFTSIAVLSGIRSKDYLKSLNPNFIINSIEDFPFELLVEE